jgi:hypothetical protein
LDSQIRATVNTTQTNDVTNSTVPYQRHLFFLLTAKREKEKKKRAFQVEKRIFALS